MNILPSLLALACSGSPETRDSGDPTSPTGWTHAATPPGVGVEPPGSTWPADTFDCIETELSYDAKKTPVTEAEVWSMMAAYAPSTVTWLNGDEYLPPGSLGTSVVSLTFSAAGEASLVTRTQKDQGPPCRPGPDLRIPVRVEVVIAEGELTGALSGYLEAAGPAFTDLYFTRIETDAPSFSPEWEAAAQDYDLYDEEFTVFFVRLYYWGSGLPEVLVTGEVGEASWHKVWDGMIR